MGFFYNCVRWSVLLLLLVVLLIQCPSKPTYKVSELHSVKYDGSRLYLECTVRGQRTTVVCSNFSLKDYLHELTYVDVISKESVILPKDIETNYYK